MKEEEEEEAFEYEWVRAEKRKKESGCWNGGDSDDRNIAIT